MDYFKNCSQDRRDSMVHLSLNFKDPGRKSWSDFLYLRLVAKKDFPWLTSDDFYFVSAGNINHPEQIALGFDVDIAMSQAEVPYTAKT